jgi:Trk K+ transport system NAD-binding subunit
MCIAGTVLLAGLTGGPMATLLRVRLPGCDTVAILGAQGLGIELAIQLRSGGIPIVFIDANPMNCRRAEEAGFRVIYGDALQERTLQRARFESVGTAIGLTPNQMLNSIFASRARQHFGIPRGYVAAINPETGLAPELVERDEIVVLFDGPHDVERWDVRSRHEELEVEHWQYGGEPAAATSDQSDEKPAPDVSERLVMLSIRRGDRVMPMQARLKLEVGDIAAIAIYREEREAAERILIARGWKPETVAGREQQAG